MSIVHAKVCAVLVAAFCLLLPEAATAQTWDAAISTGHKGGSYFYIGKRLQTTMQIRHEMRINVETSSGSIQNLARLADPSSEIGLALTQTDALNQFLNSNAEFADEFIVLGDAGKECVLLITGERSGISNFAGLKENPGGEISVDDPGSGASATISYLQAMDPEFANTTPVYVDTIEALLQIKVAGQYTKLKAAMLVQRPTTRSRPVSVLLENSNDYRLIPVLEADVENSKLPDGSVVYTFENVNIGNTSGADALNVDTICTRGLLLASKRKLSREVRSKLSAVMLEFSATVIGEDR
jgi:hypothetical protein